MTRSTDTGRTARRPAEVVLRGIDAGPRSFFYWRVLSDRQRPEPFVIESAALTAGTGLLDRALPERLESESGAESVWRALSGDLTNAKREEELSTELARLIFGDRLSKFRDALDPLSGRDGQPILRVHPSPRTARIPWELLVMGSDKRRLLELADIRYEAPVTVRADRDRRLRAFGRRIEWADANDRPVLYVLDPQQHDRLQVLPRIGSSPLLKRRLEEQGRNHRALGWDRSGGVLDGDRAAINTMQRPVDRAALGEALRSRCPSRFLYVGHVGAARTDSNRPELAALQLSGRPLTALDLLVGTTLEACDDPTGIPGAPGHVIWPMPPRVALIGCDSGSDHRFIEPFGLAVAAVNNGADLVTATRWTMPTDGAFRKIRPTGHNQEVGPIETLIVAVDRAHDAEDPFAALQQWQRERLSAWTKDGQVVNSPLFWAALVTYDAAETAPQDLLSADQIPS